MAIAREDLKRLGFKRIPPLHPFLYGQEHEVWLLDEDLYGVKIHYDHMKFPENSYDDLNGDENNLVELCSRIIGLLEDCKNRMTNEDWA